MMLAHGLGYEGILVPLLVALACVNGLAILSLLCSFLFSKFTRLSLCVAVLAFAVSLIFWVFIWVKLGPSDWRRNILTAGPVILSGFAIARSVRKKR